jgi:hypothetical protein
MRLVVVCSIFQRFKVLVKEYFALLHIVDQLIFRALIDTKVRSASHVFEILILLDSIGAHIFASCKVSIDFW